MLLLMFMYIIFIIYMYTIYFMHEWSIANYNTVYSYVGDYYKYLLNIKFSIIIKINLIGGTV